jgi:phosphohistidine swiveling domain-containing protein
MNRKERRKMSHNLGIMQYQQKLPLEKKFEIIRENIITGKKQQQEFTEEIRRQQNLTKEQRENEAIQYMAANIAKTKEIPLIDALEEAQQIFQKNTKK